MDFAIKILNVMIIVSKFKSFELHVEHHDFTIIVSKAKG